MKSSNTDFAELPAVVLHEVFCWASFVSKSRCEQVCKAWRSILAFPACLERQDGASGTGIWGKHMSLITWSSFTQESMIKIRGLLDTCEAVTFTQNNSPELLKREEDFVAWLTPRATGFHCLDVHHHRSYYNTSWLFPCLTMALSRSVRHTPALTVHTGELTHEFQCTTCQLHFWHAHAV